MEIHHLAQATQQQQPQMTNRLQSNLTLIQLKTARPVSYTHLDVYKRQAFLHKYHLIDLLRMSKYTFAQKRAQSIENYKYSFNLAQFLYKNGLYIVIVLIFIGLCAVTPIVKNTQLLTYTNILNILQQASPRMFLALGAVSYTHLIRFWQDETERQLDCF